MKITPIEIRQKSFDKNFRGYNIDEVDAFLHSLSVIWEMLLEEQSQTYRELEKSKNEIARLRQLELSLIKKIESSKTTSSNIIKSVKNLIQIESDKILKRISNNHIEQTDLSKKSINMHSIINEQPETNKTTQ